MSFLGRNFPSTLYAICLRETVNLLRNIVLQTSNVDDTKRISVDLFEKIGILVIEDIMTTAYLHLDLESWSNVSRLFLYPRLSRLICKWNDIKLFVKVKNNRIVKQILITDVAFEIKADDDLIRLSEEFLSIDFGGELFWRGRSSFEEYIEKVFKRVNESWLSSSQSIISFLITSTRKVPKYLYEYEFTRLVELNLENVNIATNGIVKILQKLPNLLWLRSYKLVQALYELHGKVWKAGMSVAKYRLRNIDADFSYVGCSSLSIGPVLPMDALQLGIELCPEAYNVRVRFDCSTHHDILLPLVKLEKLKELSIVCVTNGERSLLDFSDILPVLQHHGNNRLKSLELKVIDEVDTHHIVKYCPKLEILILSGSIYVTPITCSSFECSQNKINIPTLNKLKIFFFAEGGDEVYNNNMPQCFWYSVLAASSAHSRGKLMAIFLESPRISPKTAEFIFTNAEKAPFPNLRLLSICNYNELNANQLTSLTSGRQLKYLQVSQCQRFQLNDLIRWQKVCHRGDVLVQLT